MLTHISGVSESMGKDKSLHGVPFGVELSISRFFSVSIGSSQTYWMLTIAWNQTHQPLS